MSRRRSGCIGLLLAGVFAAIFPFLWRTAVKQWYEPHIYHTESVPESQPVAIVFGAAVYGNGRLSAVLRDRMDTAIQLYKQGTVEKLLVSGDNRFEAYDEPGAMMAYAIARGVPAADVVRDPAGLRTYDTCYRARHVFGVETAVLVTQTFHLPRAIFTCRSLGVETVGVSADLRPYRGADWYEFRETVATLAALYDVVRQQPATILSEPMHLE